MMHLYSVTVGGVYPQQCVTVTDDKARAQSLADHLNSTIRNVVTVQTVDSFYPSHMTEADTAWTRAAATFPRGA